MVEYFRTFLRFSRNGKLILSYTLIKGLTIAIQGLVYNLYLLSLHFNWQLIGVLDAMPPVTVLVVSLPLGMLADRIGRKMLLVICTLVNPFSLLGIALLLYLVRLRLERSRGSFVTITGRAASIPRPPVSANVSRACFVGCLALAVLPAAWVARWKCAAAWGPAVRTLPGRCVLLIW